MYIKTNDNDNLSPWKYPMKWWKDDLCKGEHNRDNNPDWSFYGPKL